MRYKAMILVLPALMAGFLLGRAQPTPGSLASVAGDLIPLDHYYDIVGLAAQNEREQRFEEQAARVAGSVTPKR